MRPKVCPKCGSQEVVFSSGFDLWLFPESYTCKKCGYEGQIFLELEKEDERLDIEA
jgi:predicted nucleic-acid-binding Zn-ribbon protein